MQAQDTQHCSNATLHGSYGLHATGIGFVAIGRFVFNGKLFIRVPRTNIGPIEFPGTYSLAMTAQSRTHGAHPSTARTCRRSLIDISRRKLPFGWVAAMLQVP